MRSLVQKIIVCYMVVFVCAIHAAYAQDQVGNAQTRAGELQTWREQCSDPNPDLQLAYIEGAIESGDVSVQRICIRQALESDNADVRNLGLRAALAATQQITFFTEMPKGLAAAYKAAGDDEQKLKKIADTTTDRIYRPIRNGMIVIVESAAIEKGQSTWFVLCENSKAVDYYSGKALVTGDNINWIGDIKILGGNTSKKCTMAVSALAGGKLQGVLDCEDAEPFAISADLL